MKFLSLWQTVMYFAITTTEVIVNTVYPRI